MLDNAGNRSCAVSLFGLNTLSRWLAKAFVFSSGVRGHRPSSILRRSDCVGSFEIVGGFPLLLYVPCLRFSCLTSFAATFCFYQILASSLFLSLAFIINRNRGLTVWVLSSPALPRIFSLENLLPQWISFRTLGTVQWSRLSWCFISMGNIYIRVMSPASSILWFSSLFIDVISYCFIHVECCSFVCSASRLVCTVNSACRKICTVFISKMCFWDQYDIYGIGFRSSSISCFRSSSPLASKTIILTYELFWFADEGSYQV